jgi:hypothetical protein
MKKMTLKEEMTLAEYMDTINSLTAVFLDSSAYREIFTMYEDDVPILEALKIVDKLNKEEFNWK